MKVGFGGGTVTNPGGGHFVVALDGTGHGPAHTLDHLRGQVARDGEKALLLAGIHHWQLSPLHGVARVAVELADHLHHVVVLARQQQALLPVGRETHVTVANGQRVGAGNGFFAQALHVKRHFLLPLGNQHAGIKSPREQHGAQATLEQGNLHLRRPGADCLAIVIQHPDQRKGQVVGLCGSHVHSWAALGASGGQREVRKISVVAGSPGWLRHVQVQRFALWHEVVS